VSKKRPVLLCRAFFIVMNGGTDAAESTWFSGANKLAKGKPLTTHS
jgi:hypothetical protein